MSFNVKLQEAFVKATQDKNTQMMKELGLMTRSLKVTKKQENITKKLNKAQEKQNQINLRAFAVISRSGKMIGGVTSNFNLLNLGLLDLTKNLASGFKTFFRDMRSGLKRFKADVAPPRGAPKLKLPKMRSFNLRKVSKADPASPIMQSLGMSVAQRETMLRKSGLLSKEIPGGGRVVAKRARKGDRITPAERAKIALGMGGFGGGEAMRAAFGTQMPAPTPSRLTLAQRLRFRGGAMQGPQEARVPIPDIFGGDIRPPSATKDAPALKQPGKLSKAFKSFGKNVGKPALEIAKLGLGTAGPLIAMGLLMKVISSVGATFSPVTDLITTFLELVGTGFQPLVTSLIQAMTRPEVMSLLMQFTDNINSMSTSLAPLMPLLVDLVVFNLVPMALAVDILADAFELAAPLIDDLATAITSAYQPIKDFMTLLGFDIPEAAAITGGATYIDPITGEIITTDEIVYTATPPPSQPPPQETPFAVTPFGDVLEFGGGIGDFFIDVVSDVGSFFGGLFGLQGSHIVQPPGDIFRVAEKGKPEVVSEIDPLINIIRTALNIDGVGGGGFGGQGQPIVININGVNYTSERELSLAVGRQLRLIR